MAKISTLSQQSPLVFATGQDVLGDGLLGIAEIIEMLNFAFLNRSTECHLSLSTGLDDWDEFSAIADGVGPLDIVIAGPIQIRQPIYLNSDQVAAGRTHLCGSMTDLDPGNTADVTFTLTGNAGSVATTNSHTNADNGTELTSNITIATAQSIPGWATLTILAADTGGAQVDKQLKAVRFQENPPASAITIADPGDD